MREIVLDTETTGFDPASGDRIVEIGCVELVNLIPTGKTYHQYISPERDMPLSAFKVHGLSTDFLSTKPLFASIADAFLEFIQDDILIIHNASFDMKFLNHELAVLGHKKLKFSRTVDTLQIARATFPGSPASLDALCRRYKIDNSSRTKHGALLDSELLAEVYLELKGGKQRALELAKEQELKAANTEHTIRDFHEPRSFPATEDELKQHADFIAEFKKTS